MIDDIVTQLREIKVKYVLKDEWFLANALAEAADEIERLREWNVEVTKLLKQAQGCMDIWQKSEDELIEFHHGKCAERFVDQNDEIERLDELLFQEIYSNQLKIDELEYLKTENNRWRIIATELYAAVEQMKKRRGVDMDDVDLVFDALEAYEQAVLND